MPFINIETNLILTCSANYVISEGSRGVTFAITDTKLYAQVVTLSTQNNTRLLQQLKSRFSRMINGNKNQSQTLNQYLDFLIDPSFQGVNRLFVFLFENNALTVQKMKFSIRDFFSKGDHIDRFRRIWLYLPKKTLMVNLIFRVVTPNNTHRYPKVGIKDSNVIIDGQNFFDQPVKNDLITYDSVQKIPTSQEDDCTTGCLLDYSHFKENYKLIAMDLSKQRALDADPKAMQQINFTENLN